MSKIIIIELPERHEESIKLQEILTHFGCGIRTRIGLHHGTDEHCTNFGTIILDVIGEPNSLISALQKHWKIHVI